ncbi:Histone deacetylase 6 [Blattella germanica]|nr:Histone deacetylase 6 [Blattella germanica]
MTAIDYLTAFYQIVLPISYQFNPELVLVSAGFDACIGDPLGGCKVSPEAYGHFTHLLTSLAGGRVILSLEGGYNIASISYAMPMCTKALLGDPLPPLPARQIVCPSAVNSIKNVIRTHSKYWSALCFQVALPAENIFAKRSLDKTDVKVEIDDKVIVDVKSQDDTLTKITEKGNEKTDVIKIVDLPDSNLWVDNRNLEDLNLKGTAKSDENLVMVTRSPNNENVTPATIDIVSLENSLSNLSISETTTSSPDSVSYKDLSHDTSTSSSEMSKTKFDTDNTAKTLQESISPIKLSSCNERAIIEGDFQHKLRKVGDSNKDSSGEKSQQSDGQEGASGTSSSSGDATGQQTLVDYLSENMQSILAGEMFAVVPLRSCPHLNRVQPVPSNGIDCNSPCVDCGSPQENWVCLICYSVCCGRYVNEHMMIHGVENSHPLTLSFSDLSVWCYECEAYIDNHVLYAAKNAVHRSKFGEDMPWSYGDQMTMQLHE